MKIGLVGRKCGMTRIYTDAGDSIPVTVIEVAENRVTQIKTIENDGYSALQVTIGQKKQVKINKAEGGHYSKARVGAGCGLWEIRVGSESSDLELGSSIDTHALKEVKYVDVTSTSKGKGFQGVIKRWNFSAQDATHGNSLSHRAPGSIGQNQSPGRVFKGKKMAGQMGNERVTVQNLEVVRIDHENSLILIKGAVPGSPGTIVHIRPSVKKS